MIRPLAAMLIAAVLAGCVGAGGSQPSSPAAKELDTSPGRPYLADQVLVALRTAAESDPTFDARLARLEVAHPLAEGIITFDGRPYEQLELHADCNPVKCGITAVGHRAQDGMDDGSGRVDRWDASAAPDRGAATLFPALAVLRAYPASFDVELDRLVMAAVPHDRLAGLALREGRWLLPPASGFELRYEDPAHVRGVAVTFDPRNNLVTGIRDYDPMADVMY